MCFVWFGLFLFFGCGAQYVLTPEEIAEIALGSTVVLVVDESSLGSGFVVQNGLIATNHHVIEESTKIATLLIDSRQVYAVEDIWAVDEKRDLAVVKVTGIDAPPLPLGDSDAVQIGQTIYVAGNPEGLYGTFSAGVISAIRGAFPLELEGEIFQMTAPISPGSSGGPVLNSRGEVIGISVGYYEEGQNLNFAIPVNSLKSLLKETVPTPS